MLRHIPENTENRYFRTIFLKGDYFKQKEWTSLLLWCINQATSHGQEKPPCVGQNGCVTEYPIGYSNGLSRFLAASMGIFTSAWLYPCVATSVFWPTTARATSIPPSFLSWIIVVIAAWRRQYGVQCSIFSPSVSLALTAAIFRVIDLLYCWDVYTENGDKLAGFPREKAPFCHRLKYNTHETFT